MGRYSSNVWLCKIVLQIWSTCTVCTDVCFLQGLSTTSFFSHVRYWHQSLNPWKLIAVRFSHLTRNLTMLRTLKLFRLPEVSIRKFIFRSAEFVKNITANLKFIICFRWFSVSKLMSIISELFWMMYLVFIFLNLSYDNMKVKSFIRENMKKSKAWFYDVLFFHRIPKHRTLVYLFYAMICFSTEYQNTWLSSIYPCWCPGVF